jgi:hypothetical protein
MFYHQENPGVTCAKNLRKGTKPKIREILAPHFLQRGPKSEPERGGNGPIRAVLADGFRWWSLFQRLLHTVRDWGGGRGIKSYSY